MNRNGTPQGVFFNGRESAKNRPREQKLDALRTLAEGKDGLSPFFFLRQQEKMTFGGWQNSKRDEKVSKTVKKSSKKVLTEGRDCDIIIELSVRAKRRADSDDP